MSDDDEFSEDLPEVEMPAAVARWFAEARAFHRAWRGDGVVRSDEPHPRC